MPDEASPVRIPDITVAIATTGRPSIEGTLVALAAQTISGDAFLVSVVENTPQPRLPPLLRRFAHRLNLEYRVHTEPGKTGALNTVIRGTPSPLLAFIDDDCRPAPDWLERILATFAAFPDVPCVSGQFITVDSLPAPDPSVRGLQDSRRCTIRGTGRRPWEILRGGNFAVRRRLFDEVGYFDPDFGPGAPISSGDESEWLLRVLLREGECVRYEPDMCVVHTPPWGNARDARTRVGEYYASTGALLAKHLLAGQWRALSILNPLTYFPRTPRRLRREFAPRLATALRTIPYLCIGAFRYLRLRAGTRRRTQPATGTNSRIVISQYERASVPTRSS